MKIKHKKTFILGAVIILIIMIGVVISTLAYFQTRFSTKARITGTYEIIVNGAEYHPEEEFLEYENNGTQRLNNDGDGKFQIQGGKYGEYRISFYLDNNILSKRTNDDVFNTLPEKTLLTFSYINTNWWHVTDMQLTADLFKESNEWMLKIKACYTESTEDGSTPTKQVVENTVKYIDEAQKGDIALTFGT